MRVFKTDSHSRHHPKSFLARGVPQPCPERPERGDILLAAVSGAGHTIVDADPVNLAALRRVHDPAYLAFLERAWDDWSALDGHGPEIVPNVHSTRNMARVPEAIVGRAGHYQADTACPIGPGTWEGVTASAGVAVSAAEALMADMQGAGAGARAPFAYALCRPPGHHAFADQAGGFCFLNNSALAAEACLAGGARRVAILDVDVHHGNGTQGIFYDRNDVLTVSLHGDPRHYYPFFAGYADERGAGSGRGFNINKPLPKGTNDQAYHQVLDAVLEDIAAYRPDVLIVALGLDASEADPLAFFGVTTDGFRHIGTLLAQADLPTLLVQEGGYISDVLGANLVAVLGGFEDAVG